MRQLSRYGDPWTPEEDDLLRRDYQGRSHLQALAAQTGRSPDAIYSRAAVLGLTRAKHYAKRSIWGDEEVAYLQEILQAHPLKIVLKKLNAWRYQRGLRERNYTSLKQYLRRNKLKGRMDGNPDLLTIAHIAEGLRCPKNRVKRMFRDRGLRKMLNPEFSGDAENSITLISRKRLRKVFIAYPGLLDGLSPDMAWFIDLIANS
jgi:hypothetical protein